MNAAPVFVADSMGKSFGGRRVLTAATIHASPERITVLVGRNGTGKSTLLKVACGVRRADYGVVRLGEERFVTPRLPILARRGVFYFPQDRLLVTGVTLRRHLDAVSYACGGGATAGAVRQLEVEGLLDRPAHKLSGGEQRRAELAVVVGRGPKILLADEPFTGIMPRDAELIGATLRGLAENGCAVVVTGHEVDTLFGIGDEIVWLTAGTTHSLGSSEEAVRHHQFRREFLGPGFRAPAPLGSDSVP